MAVQRPYQEQASENVSDLALAPRPGSGRMLRRIAVANASQPAWATIQNGPTTVGYYRVGADEENHLAMRPANTGGMNVYDLLKALALPYKIPVNEGDTLTVTLSAGTGDIKLEWADVDPGDIDPTQPFGRSAKSMPMMLYGTNSAAAAASDYAAIDDSLMPSAFTQFPFARDAEPGRTYAVHALMAQDIDVTTTTAGEEWATDRLRVTLNREVLYDPTQAGFLTIGKPGTEGLGVTFKGQGTNQLPFAGDQLNRQPFILNDALMVNAGDELKLDQLVNFTAGAGFAAGDLLVALLTELNPPAKQGG